MCDGSGFVRGLFRAGSAATRVAGALFLALVWGAVAASAANAQICSVAYQKSLATVRDVRTPLLNGLTQATRTSEPAMTGRWLFAGSQFDKAKGGKQPTRVCAENQMIKGRSRCVRFEDQVDFKVEQGPTADEAKLLRGLMDFVEAKGAVPELGPNGRHGFLVTRAAQDFRLYIAQTHSSMCAGAGDLVEFYMRQLTPLIRRSEEVADITKRLAAATAVRLRAVSIAESEVYAKALAKQVAASAAVPVVEGDDAKKPEPAGPAISGLIKPEEPAPLAAYAGKPLMMQVLDVVRRILPPAAVTQIAVEPTPIASLVLARGLLKEQAKGGGETFDPLVREAAGAALRMIEARAYAELLVLRYAAVDAALFATASDIRKAFDKTCTCPDER
jgi:hypothetical protein